VIAYLPSKQEEPSSAPSKKKKEKEMELINNLTK
jgi:hypothetical protein